MAKSRWLLSFLAFVAIAGVPAPAWAATLRIIDFSYGQHFIPGEPMKFLVRVQNREPTAQGIELVIIFTNLETHEETVPIDIGSDGNVPTGAIFTFTPSPTAIKGTYTVTFRVLDGNALRSDQVTGTFPIHVGEDADTLHVFPDALDFGILPPGRSMHPVPLEIRWSFFRFNRLAHDQPFYIRVYTDNAARHRGVPGAIRRSGPAGLVSSDGRYTIPIKIWTANFGPDVQETGWDSNIIGPPPVDDDTSWIGPLLTTPGEREVGAVAWTRIPDFSEMSSDPSSWRRLIGQNPDDTRFVTDTNRTGDFTLPSPITAYVATETGPTSVAGTYSATLIVELYGP